VIPFQGGWFPNIQSVDPLNGLICVSIREWILLMSYAQDDARRATPTP
jgi:hypothetical protein